MILRFGYSFFVPSFISVHLVHLEYVLVVVCKSFFLFLVTILAAQRKQKTKNHTFAHFSFDFFSLCSFIFPCSSSFFEYRLVILVPFFCAKNKNSRGSSNGGKVVKIRGRTR